MLDSSSGSNIVVHPRQDSSVEPRAYRPARWPPSSITTYSSPNSSPPPTDNQLTLKSNATPNSSFNTPTTPRRFPRSFTAPVPGRPSSSPSTAGTSDLSEASRPNPPVLLTPGLSPTLRDILPHPKAVRPRPFPTHSDLSAASTRAEHEPTALRDLRRVTAPPALLDPAHYQNDSAQTRRRDRDNRRRYIQLNTPVNTYLDRLHRDPDALDRDFSTFRNHHLSEEEQERLQYRRSRHSPSVSSLVTDRLSEGARRDRWSLLSDGLRPRSASRSSRLYKFTIRNWLFPRDKLTPPVIPDRLRDVDHPNLVSHADRSADRSAQVYRNERHAPDDPLTRPRPSSLDDVAHAHVPPVINKELFQSGKERTGMRYDALNKLGEDDLFTEDEPYDMRLGAPLRFDAQYDGSMLHSDLFCEEEELSHGHRILKHRNAMRTAAAAYEVANGDAREEQGIRGGATRRGHSLTHVEQKASEESRRGNTTDIQVRGEPEGYEEGDEHSQDGNEQSVISALTNESDVADTMRTRSISEAVVHRRLSLVQTKDKVLSVWDRLVNRRRAQVSRRHQQLPRDSSPSPLRTSWLRFRSADTLGLNASF